MFHFRLKNAVLSDSILDLTEENSALTDKISADLKTSERMIENVEALKIICSISENVMDDSSEFQDLKDKYFKAKKDIISLNDKNCNLNKLNLQYFEKVQELMEDINAQNQLLEIGRAAEKEYYENIDKLQMVIVKKNDKINELEKLKLQVFDNSEFAKMKTFSSSRSMNCVQRQRTINSGEELVHNIIDIEVNTTKISEENDIIWMRMQFEQSRSGEDVSENEKLLAFKELNEEVLQLQTILREERVDHQRKVLKCLYLMFMYVHFSFK